MGQDRKYRKRPVDDDDDHDRNDDVKRRRGRGTEDDQDNAPSRKSSDSRVRRSGVSSDSAQVAESSASQNRDREGRKHKQKLENSRTEEHPEDIPSDSRRRNKDRDRFSKGTAREETLGRDFRADDNTEESLKGAREYEHSKKRRTDGEQEILSATKHKRSSGKKPSAEGVPEAETEKEDRNRHKDTDIDRDKNSEKAKDRERSSLSAKDRDRDREKDKDRDREKDMRDEKERPKDAGKDRDRERRDKDKGRFKEEDRERSKDRREREKGSDRDGDKERDRERKDRERDCELEGDKERKDRERDRERDRDKDRSRRSRSPDRRRSRSPDRRRSRSAERDRDRDRRDRDRDRDRRDGEKEGRRRKYDDDDDRSGRDREKKREKEDVKKTEEELEKEKEEAREREQAKLDEEMEKRRQRVEAWQAMRRQEQEEKEKEQEAAAVGRKQWTLEDGEDDDEDAQDDSGDSKKEPEDAPAPMQEEDEDDIDPLDAFMLGITAQVKKLDKVEVKKVSTVEVKKDTRVERVVAEPAPAVVVKQESESSETAVDEVKPVVNGDSKVVAGASTASPAPKAAAGQKLTSPTPPPKSTAAREGDAVKQVRYFSDDDDNTGPMGSGSDGEEYDSDDDLMPKKKRKKEIPTVDHSTITYEPFRKNFYIEVPEISRMSNDEVVELRKELDNIKIRGKNCPRPVKTWYQAGLSNKIYEVLRKLGLEKPTPIQAQSLPCIMSGRDVIGCARTGSGKTLAFVLPMFRHILDQPPLEPGDGPMGLIMAPTRELAIQIHMQIKKFTKALNLQCVCVYGGAGVKDQIGELKRGTEIIVCTPGRMIDILTTNSGRVTNLRRITYVVLDEADRMFDMGFEPQITKVIENTRPDRQTVMFSATFPRQVETLAKKILTNPVEITVGGRSVVCADVEQHIEVRPEETKFFRLLELLGEWAEQGSALVFVDRQDTCDNLFKDLLKHGYLCLSLHGGKDQADRDCTIADFKNKVSNVMVATSVAARGLDVKDLILVVNYEVPNHYEDYVHRCGRTGRAGNKGYAYTFITPEEDKYAVDLVKGLEQADVPVPDELRELAQVFRKKCDSGQVQYVKSSGFGGKGYKFDEAEQAKQDAQRKQLRLEYGVEENQEEEEEDDSVPVQSGGPKQVQPGGVPASTIPAAVADAVAKVGSLALTPIVAAAAAQAKAAVVAHAQAHAIAHAKLAASGGGGTPGAAGGATDSPTPVTQVQGVAAAAAFAAALSVQTTMARVASLQKNPALLAAAQQAAAAIGVKTGTTTEAHFEDELEINDFPQQARWKVTHKDALSAITDWTGAAITTRGQYYAPGKQPPAGDRRLFLFIEGPTAISVQRAKAEIRRVIAEASANIHPEKPQPGRYSVL